VARPSNAAAVSCGQAPAIRLVGATSRYAQRKYATVISVTLSISGIQNTRYTGNAVAPKNAVVKSAAPTGDERAARKTYAQMAAMASRTTFTSSRPFSPKARTNGAAIIG